MTRNELFEMATNISHDVIKRNQDYINDKIATTFKVHEDDSTMSIHEALGYSIAMMLKLVPEISAAVTAQMLVDLDLVPVEADD